MKMIEKVRRYAIAGSLLFHIGQFIRSLPTRIRKKIDNSIGLCTRKLVYQWCAVQKNKIFIMTYDFRYSCNPKYIVEEILRQELPVEIVWVGPQKSKMRRADFPPSIRLVRRGSYTMYREMGTAKIWIDNALNCVWDNMPKKKSQIYINTWHGSLGIKKLSGNDTWLRRAKRCRKVTDYCISNSIFEEHVYQDTFWDGIPYLRYGHARNDILFDRKKQECLKEKIYTFFELDPERTVNFLLYAPTFRDNGNMDWCDLDFERLKVVLEEKFGGEWIILVRMHFKNKAKRLKGYNEWLKNASGYPDMQELLTVTTVGITDYSSWAYDYILTRHPLFIYAPDIDEYDQARGFYYRLEETPFPVASNNDELEEKILSFYEDEYIKKTEEFLQEKGCIEDGHASERIVELIRKEIL